MIVHQQKRAIGTFSSRETVEKLLQALNEAGFSKNNISLIGRELSSKDEELGEAQTSDRVGNTKINTAHDVVANTATIGATGFALLGLTSLALPGIGVVVAAGSFLAAMAATTASSGVAALAANNLVKALADLGIPETQASVYSDRLQQGSYIVMVEGTDEEIQQAEGIFRKQGSQDWLAI